MPATSAASGDRALVPIAIIFASFSDRHGAAAAPFAAGDFALEEVGPRAARLASTGDDRINGKACASLPHELEHR